MVRMEGANMAAAVFSRMRKADKSWARSLTSSACSFATPARFYNAKRCGDIENDATAALSGPTAQREDGGRFGP